jgi:uncharacterized coiled-coil protein SlyX
MTEDRMNPNPRITTCEELETIVARQNQLINGMADLVRAMDLRIRTVDNLLTRLTEIVAVHHQIFVRQGICKPTGGEYASGQKTN